VYVTDHVFGFCSPLEQVEKRIALMFGMKAKTLKDWAYNPADKVQPVPNLLPYPSRPSPRQSNREGTENAVADEASVVTSRPTDASAAHPRSLFQLPPLPGAACL
jgi:hypothetical protein